MILILSEEGDRSTTEVIKWLRYQNKRWVRINREQNIKISFNNNVPHILCDSKTRININLITSVWFRRGVLNIQKKTDNTSINNFLSEENYYLKNYVYYFLSRKIRVGEINSSFINKLIVNEIACSVGLSIPNTYLLTSQTELEKKMKKHQLITKVIAGNGFLKLNEEHSGIMYTSAV